MKTQSRRFKKPELIVLPNPNTATITQQEIGRIIFVENMIRDFRQELHENAGRLLERLQSGAQAEPGTNRAELTTRTRGGRWQESLLVNGREVEA